MQRIRCRQLDFCPPNSKIVCQNGKKSPRQTDSDSFGGLEDFLGFFETKKSTALPRTCGRSAANPLQVFGSAADSGGVPSRSAGVRGKNASGGSARRLPEVHMDLHSLQRVRSGLKSAIGSLEIFHTLWALPLLYELGFHLKVCHHSLILGCSISKPDSLFPTDLFASAKSGLEKITSNVYASD